MAWYATELARRMLLGLAGALPAFVVSWVFRAKILEFLMLPALFAVTGNFTIDGVPVTRSFPAMFVHLSGSSPWMFWKAAIAGGLVPSAPWTAYQAFRYAARRTKPGGTVRIGSFVTASTAVVSGSAWLVPNLLVPALPLSLPWVGGLHPNPRAYEWIMTSWISGLLHLVCATLLTVCVAALVPIVVAFVISATRASWRGLVHFGGLCVLLVSAGVAAVLSSACRRWSPSSSPLSSPPGAMVGDGRSASVACALFLSPPAWPRPCRSRARFWTG